MNRVVTSRIATLMSAAAIIVIAACSDANDSLAKIAGPSAPTSGGLAADSAQNPPGNPDGGHPDTGVTRTPAPQPVASFTLLVHVGSTRPGATDTLTTTPIPGATVAIFEQTLTPVNHPGADTVNINQTLVASGVSDASGNFTASKLKGAAVYAIKVTPPAGTDFQPATQYLNQAFADLVKTSVTLFGK